MTTFQYPIGGTLCFPIIAKKKKKKAAQNVVKALIMLEVCLKSRNFTKEVAYILLLKSHKLHIFTGF